MQTMTLNEDSAVSCTNIFLQKAVRKGTCLQIHVFIWNVAPSQALKDKVKGFVLREESLIGSESSKMIDKFGTQYMGTIYKVDIYIVTEYPGSL